MNMEVVFNVAVGESKCCIQCTASFLLAQMREELSLNLQREGKRQCQEVREGPDIAGQKAWMYGVKACLICSLQCFRTGCIFVLDHRLA